MQRTPETQTDIETEVGDHRPAGNVKVVAAVAVLIAAFAALGWFSSASPVASMQASTTHATATSPQPAQGDRKAASVGALIGGLESRLAQDPEDAKGWLLLAKSHEHLGNISAARDAYARAKALGLEDLGLEAKLNDQWLAKWQADAKAAGGTR